MSIQAIESALLLKLTTLNPGIAIVHEGEPYTPSDNTPYLRVEFIPNETPATGQEAGQDAPVREAGLLQLTPVYPVASGPGPLKAMNSVLKTAFKWKQTVQAVGFKVRIDRCSRGRLVSDAGWNSLPVIVRWSAHTPGD
ncbi:phage tail terminator-like protein [Maricaulis sp. MIT060901]|uniref:phage tail terminator-like protein n=1 Tax=Maricaulis sp. MIT060901 TaxID=3096993 RepID=UPI00399BB794